MMLFELCAVRGDARAEYVLALCYRNGGDDVSPSPEQAFYYFQKAADHGDSDALFKLAMCLYEGDGTTKNISEAIRYFRLAANQGDAEAAYRLSVAFSEGQGVPLDAVEATKWLELAADYGQAESQFQLGLRYRHGQGASRQPEVVCICVSLIAPKPLTSCFLLIRCPTIGRRLVSKICRAAPRWSSVCPRSMLS